MTLCDECYVWGGSPAVESIPEGLESSTDSEYSRGSTSSQLVEDANAEENSLGKETSEMEGEDVDLGTKDIGERRKELLQFIKEKKDSRLTKRHSADTQLLDIAKEEVALKKEPLT